MAVSASTLNTVASYAVLGLIAATVYFMQKPKRPALPTQKSQPEPPKEKNTKKKDRAEKIRQETKDKPQADPPVVQYTPAAHDSTEDEVNNRDFAQQFASVQRGTNFEAKTSNQVKKQKSVKQSRAEVNTFGDDKPSGPSSTTGNDADDDQSPALSPEVGPTDAGDVSDMLPPAPAGPSSLRLVDTDTGKLKQQPKKEKPTEAVPTKKQRQNKKRAEADKAQRQAAEEERKAKEEAQRRKAREAEGRLPKDGSQYTNAAVNGSKSAWKNGSTSTSTNTKTPQDALSTLPLDTFDKPAEARVPAAAYPHPPSQPTKNWMDSVPSEETQMQMLQDEQWNTVPSKSKKSKKAATNEVSEETVAAIAAAAVSQAPIPSRPLPQQKQHGGGVKTNGKPALTSGGSFAALSTEDPVEEEWDI